MEHAGTTAAVTAMKSETDRARHCRRRLLTAGPAFAGFHFSPVKAKSHFLIGSYPTPDCISLGKKTNQVEFFSSETAAVDLLSVPRSAGAAALVVDRTVAITQARADFSQSDLSGSGILVIAAAVSLLICS